MNGFNSESLNGLSNIYADDIETNTFLDQNSNLFTGISSNIQTQINTINSLVSSGGGYFAITATQNSGYIPNTYWGFNSGTNPSVNIPLVFAYSFKIISITIISQSTPTSPVEFVLSKNAVTIYTSPSYTIDSISFNDLNLSL